MEKTATLANAPRIGAIVDEIRELRTRTLDQFNAVRDCFIEGDTTKADLAQKEQEAISELFREVFARLAESELSANKAVVCTVGAYSIARVGEHLASIARCVTEPLDRIRRVS